MRTHVIDSISEVTLVGPVLAFVLAVLLIACSSPSHLPVGAHPASSPSVPSPSENLGASTLPLKVLVDIPLTGGTTRLDYQKFGQHEWAGLYSALGF